MFARVTRADTPIPDGASIPCLLWMGNTGRNGYGRVDLPGRGAPKVQAHRAWWMWVCGYELEPDDDLHHRYKCDRRCVEPSHLERLTSDEHDRLHQLERVEELQRRAARAGMTVDEYDAYFDAMEQF
jgi:hypothetical protein